jgi:GMP synthase PP-ATPase subunit
VQPTSASKILNQIINKQKKAKEIKEAITKKAPATLPIHQLPDNEVRS